MTCPYCRMSIEVNLDFCDQRVVRIRNERSRVEEVDT